MTTVRYGMEGYVVQLLQYALLRAGMDVGHLDGIFGRRTARAVQQFQRTRGLSTDGIAGKLTWAALFPSLTGYTVHRIANGDTFVELAQRYGTCADTLRIANPAMDGEVPPAGEVMTVPLNMPVVAALIPFSGRLTDLMLQGLSMRYPFLHVYEIGRSVMGQRIMAAYMGEGPKQVGFVAAHHGNEWIAATMLLRFAEEYASAYASDGTIGGVSARELYRVSSFHMVPLVNPDGADLVTGALSPSDSFYAQAEALASYYPDIPFPMGWQSNILGVDLDLQYPVGWESARQSRYAVGFTRPGPKGYVGSGPLTAPENRAVVQWTMDRDLALVISSDDGNVSWFTKTTRRPGFLLTGIGKDDPDFTTGFDRLYRANLPLLVQSLTISP